MPSEYIGDDYIVQTYHNTLRVWSERLCHFLDHIILHNLVMMIIYTHNGAQNVLSECEFLEKSVNLPPQTFMSWNSLTLGH